MAWARVVAISGALLALPSLASAQAGLTERLRVQGIYAHQTGGVADDFALQGMPELSLLVLDKRAQLRVTYTLTATGHTTLPVDLANRLNLTSSFDLSKRTTLLLSAEAGHSTVANTLINQPPSAAPVGVVPLTAGQVLTTRAGQGITWEASPVVRFTQTLDAAYITTLNAPLASETYLLNAVVSVDRVWKADAVGVDLRGGYTRSRTEPFPPVHLVPLALSPHWRHDISRTFTSYIAAGPLVLLSPDPGTKPLVRPFAQGSLDYFLDDATFELLGTMGAQPNPLTAQLLYAEQVTFRATTPLSLEHGVGASAAVGYSHATVVDGGRAGIPQPDLDSVIADAGVFWAPNAVVELFARYQFIDQLSTSAALVTTPAVQRHAIILGIQLSSRPDPIRVPTKFPQRVDRSDGAAPVDHGDAAPPP